MNLFQSYSSLIKSSGAGDKVFGLLDRSPPAPATGSLSVQSLGGPTAHGEAALSLQLVDVSFVYPSRPEHSVLKGLNLTIRPGQTVALVGPSGCGKSTVCQLLQRLYDPTQGCVLVNGSNLKGLDIKSHRYVISLWFQGRACEHSNIIFHLQLPLSIAKPLEWSLRIQHFSPAPYCLT